MLVCAGDKERRPAKNWTKDFNGNERISYFVGLDAKAGSGEWLLSGDRNITGQIVLTNGMVLSSKEAWVKWTNGNHGIVGLMLESNLFPGSQKLTADPALLHYGVSITDGCIGWDETESLLLDAHSKLAGH